jgi:predicted nucleic acid-binding Zn ribbon protein
LTVRRTAAKRTSKTTEQKPPEPRGPRPIAEIVNQLLARRGYARIQAVSACQQAWQQAAGTHLAPHTRPGNIRRGVLEITVRNSTVLQELTFQKKPLLKKLQSLIADQNIRDLRFRVGALD